MTGEMAIIIYLVLIIYLAKLIQAKKHGDPAIVAFNKTVAVVSLTFLM